MTNPLRLIVLAVLWLAAAPVSAQAGSHGDFLTYLPALKAQTSLLDQRSSGWAVTVEVAPLLAPAQGSFRLVLPDGEKYEVTGEVEGFAGPSRFTWHGSLRGSYERVGQIVISVQNEAIAGKIYTPEATYVLSPVGRKQAVLSRQDDSEPLGCEVPGDDVALPLEKAGDEPLQPTVGFQEDGSVIDILVLYTAAARTAAGSRDNVESTIRMAVADANLAFTNSAVATRFNAVGVREIAYEETGDSDTDLLWVRRDTGVANLRNELAADLVGMVVSEMEDEVCGSGMVMSAERLGPGFATLAFQVTRLSCLDNHTLAHEFGHNMGATHNPENFDENVNTPPAYPYGHGHYVNGSFRTIMSYAQPCSTGCRRVAHFSNPDIQFNGEPTGIADERDNHRVFNNTAVIVANFRVPLPGVPANVQATDGTYSDRVRITWSRVDRAERYTVYRATSATATKEVLTGSATSTSFDDTTAVPGTTYFYWVKAFNSAGQGGISASDTGYRQGGAPARPTSVSATDGTYTDRVRITWSAVPGATRYLVYRATSATGTRSVLTSSWTVTTFDDTTAVPGTTYVYWVRASNSAGMSDYSLSDTGYRRLSPPTPPTGVSATDGLYPDRVEITWGAVSGATYSVYRATTSTGTKSLLASGLASALFNDTTAAPGTVYYYWVKASNSAGSSDFSASNTGYRRIASLSPPTGVAATDGTYTDRVRITWSAVSGATRYLVYRATSATGTRTVLTTNVSETGFNDTTAVPGTVYYYWVRAANGTTMSDYSASNTGYRRR